MAEEDMVRLAQAALDHHGVEDTVGAVGQFAPRGQSGAMFAGGMAGADAGDAIGGGAGGVGLSAGLLAGKAANAETSGLAAEMFIAVSESAVYGMSTRSRRSEPDAILFTLPRDRLTAQVHQRVSVRVLELVDTETGAKVELEGNRLPITHSKDVIDLLTSG